MKTLSAYAKTATLLSVVAANEPARFDVLALLRMCGRDYLEAHGAPLPISANDTHATLEAVVALANKRHAQAGTRETLNDASIASIVRFCVRKDAMARKLAAANEPMRAALVLF